MTTHSERYLKTGGDPRTLADYAALRDEMNKLTHPARPDVNWQYAEKLCLSLFENNGVELQTAAWYTLARVQLAGLYGLNEGLAILDALVSRQWSNLWPQPVHARMDILSALSKRLQQTVRTLTLTYADLSQLYRAEQHLTHIGEVLQRLELKHLSQTEALRAQLHNAAVRLESVGNAGPQDTSPAFAGALLPAASAGGESDPVVVPEVQRQWIFVAQPEPVMKIIVPTRPWKAFVAGMALMLAAGGAALWGWQAFHRPDPLVAQLNASLAPAPEPLTTAQLQTLRQQNLPPEVIARTQQQLERLSRLPPDYALRQGELLIQQLQILLPEDLAVKQLAHQWRQQSEAAALPRGTLVGWHQGMMQLQQLTNQLNALDAKRGKYMTGSELKSQVFAITQSFSQTPPVEEQLRQIQSEQEGSSARQQQLLQVKQHLRALLYTLNVPDENEGSGDPEGKR